MRNHQGFHGIYNVFLEAYLMTHVGYNTSYVPHDQDYWRYISKDTPDWIKMVRRQMGVKVFERVDYINKAWPLKQGVKKDRRFQAGSGKCANPETDCPGKPTLSDLSSLGPLQGILTCADKICKACYGYYLRNGSKWRTDAMVHNLGRLHEAANSGCEWCGGLFTTSLQSGKSNYLKDLGRVLCNTDARRWRGTRKELLPVPGVHFSGDHVFECENAQCRDSHGHLRTDKTVARKWYFDVAGSLRCEECHWGRMPRNEKRELKDREDDTLVSHKVAFPDDMIRGANARGYQAYVKLHFDIDLTGTTDDMIKAIHGYMIEFKDARDANFRRLMLEKETQELDGSTLVDDTPAKVKGKRKAARIESDSEPDEILALLNVKRCKKVS